MRRLTILVAAVLVAVFASTAQDRQLVRPVAAPADGVQKRLALVIGNAAYQKVAPLANPVNDAGDMATTLQSLGFEVIRGSDTNLVQMKRLIRQFGEKLEQQKGVGLFFYAGHGIEVKGKNYLVPVDAEIGREIETEDAAIELDSVLRQMDAAANGFNIVILDACRNNPFSRGWNRAADTGGLANLNAPTGTYIAYAAAPGTTASDGKGTRNGVFTGALLKNLKRPNLKLEEVFKATREEVMTATGSRQVPWDSSSIKGDFYFQKTAVTTTGATAKVDPTAVEAEYWATIKDSSDAADFEAYLKEYPAGQYTSLARLKLSKLRSVTKPGNTSDKARSPGSISKTTLPGGVEMTFAYVPAGEFDMGSLTGEPKEQPVHRVKISRGFEMGTTEVTQDQWTSVMGRNPSHFLNCPTCPVENVDWNDVQEFVRTLNKRNDGYVYRLPTEGEWECAARAGSTGDFAGDLDSMAWYSVNAGNRTHEVAMKNPNDWGLYDMHGNVSELVQDWSGTYPGGPVTDPTGPAAGLERINRGGSWLDGAGRLRWSERSKFPPTARGGDLGFRLVRQ